MRNIFRTTSCIALGQVKNESPLESFFNEWIAVCKSAGHAEWNGSGHHVCKDHSKGPVCSALGQNEDYGAVCKSKGTQLWDQLDGRKFYVCDDHSKGPSCFALGHSHSDGKLTAKCTSIPTKEWRVWNVDVTKKNKYFVESSGQWVCERHSERCQAGVHELSCNMPAVHECDHGHSVCSDHEEFVRNTKDQCRVWDYEWLDDQRCTKQQCWKLNGEQTRMVAEEKKANSTNIGPIGRYGKKPVRSRKIEPIKIKPSYLAQLTVARE